MTDDDDLLTVQITDIGMCHSVCVCSGMVCGEVMGQLSGVYQLINYLLLKAFDRLALRWRRMVFYIDFNIVFLKVVYFIRFLIMIRLE